MTARNCGSGRIFGGVYAVALTSPDGHPIAELLIDEPIPLARVGLDHLSAIGVHLVEPRPGSTYIVDRISVRDYPDVAGFIEEARLKLPDGRLFGLSRRIPKTFPFERINADTLLALSHDRAYIVNANYYLEREPREDQALKQCPLLIGFDHCARGGRDAAWKHATGNRHHCARLWWQDVTNFDGVPIRWQNNGQRLVVGKFASGTYRAYARHRRVTPVYQPAIFMRSPIRLEVIRDPDAGTHEEAWERASRSSVDVALVDA